MKAFRAIVVFFFKVYLLVFDGLYCFALVWCAISVFLKLKYHLESRLVLATHELVYDEPLYQTTSWEEES